MRTSGGGPAGLTAALYLAREGVDTLVIERAAFGGQAAATEKLDNLPGFPDNLSRGPSGLFWCALVSPRKPEIDFVMPYPPLRRLIYRIPERLQPKATRYAFVLGLNEQGEVVHNLQDPTGAFGEVTGVVEHEGYLYLGSLVEEAIGRIKLPT